MARIRAESPDFSRLVTEMFRHVGIWYWTVQVQYLKPKPLED